MTIVTIFALFGDDMRLWMTTKQEDVYFFYGLSFSFVLFSAELLVNSCVGEDFKYSFFFWLDFIATLSLIPDIAWFSNFLNRLLGFQETTFEMDIYRGGALQTSDNSNLAKVVKSVRLIRLIRIIKLYNYAVKSNSEAEEAKLSAENSLKMQLDIATENIESEERRLIQQRLSSSRQSWINELRGELSQFLANITSLQLEYGI